MGEKIIFPLPYLSRRALRDRDVDFLQNMLPPSSFRYIYEYLDMLRDRKCQPVERKYSICLTERLQKVKELIEMIKQKGTVIIYGIGRDTKNYREIYFECMDMGIDKRRIKYNPYNYLYSSFLF